MNEELDIVSWNPGMLAITGKLLNPHRLLERIREVAPVRCEYSRDSGRAFTYSFPERYQRQVARVVERFPE